MVSKEHHALLFGVRRSIRYHSRRQAFYESLDQWTTFILLLLGTGMIATALNDLYAWMFLVGFLVSAIAGLKLAFACGTKAGLHAQLVKDFTLLEKRLRADSSEETVAAITQERLDLEAAEPPVMHVLNVICHNELLRAMGITDNSERVPVTWLQRLTANFFDYGEHRLAKSGRR